MNRQVQKERKDGVNNLIEVDQLSIIDSMDSGGRGSRDNSAFGIRLSSKADIEIFGLREEVIKFKK